MLLIVSFCILLASLHFLLKRHYNYWKQKDVPHLRPIPLIGNIAPILFRKSSIAELSSMWYCSFSDKRFVGFFQFFTPVLMIRDLELIKRVTVKEFDTFCDHRIFATDDIDPLWGKCVVGLNGQKWSDMRSILSSSLTPAKMQSMFPLLKECAKQFMNYIQKQNGFIVLEMKDEMGRFINDVIATTSFGVMCNSYENRENKFFAMAKDMSDFSGIKALRFVLYSISPTLMKLLRIGIFSREGSLFFRKLMKETLKLRREQKIVRLDVVHLLIEAQKGRFKNECAAKDNDSNFGIVDDPSYNKPSKNDSPQITNEEITAQAIIFFVAGFETTSTMMCFAVYELALNVDVQKKLQEEIDCTMRTCDGDITFEALMKMKYLDMVITETLRKWPPAPALDRLSVKPFSIKAELPNEADVILDAGSMIFVPIFAIHRDARYFPEPEKFDPERFNGENKRNVKSFSYLPFGSGPRSCIGYRFAMLEGKLLLVELLSKYDIVPVTQTQIPITLNKSSFPLRTEKGVWLGLKPREHGIA